MAKSSGAADAAEAVFKALADPTRRSILANLARGEMAAGDIAGRFDISGPSISRHLSVLRAAGLVKERRAANRVIYAVQPDALTQPLNAFLAYFSAAPARARGKRARGTAPGAGGPKKPARVSAHKPAGDRAPEPPGKKRERSAPKTAKGKRKGDRALSARGQGAGSPGPAPQATDPSATQTTEASSP